jgi:CO dehydrogenase/acetyl-CoA synthase gamma subunit (corrinoid Fe-S protein)
MAHWRLHSRLERRRLVRREARFVARQRLEMRRLSASVVRQVIVQVGEEGVEAGGFQLCYMDHFFNVEIYQRMIYINVLR